MPFPLTDRIGSFGMLVNAATALWPIDGTFPFRTGTWAKSTRTLTKAAAFTNFIFEGANSDLVFIRSGGGFIPGLYAIESHTTGNNPIVLLADPRLEQTSPTASDLAGYALGNPSSYNAGVTSSSGNDSILQSCDTVIEGFELLKTDASARDLTIMQHDGTTTIDNAISFVANQPCPLYLPIGGTFGRFVRGGISVKIAGGGAAVYGMLYGRMVK